MLHFTQSRAVLPLALIAAVAATFLQGAAFASPAPAATHRTLSIPVNGLDLSRSQDVAKLTLHIQSAARTVCKPEDARNLKAQIGRSDCENQAIGMAVGQRDTLVAQAQDRAVRMAAAGETAPSTN